MRNFPLHAWLADSTPGSAIRVGEDGRLRHRKSGLATTMAASLVRPRCCAICSPHGCPCSSAISPAIRPTTSRRDDGECRRGWTTRRHALPWLPRRIHGVSSRRGAETRPQHVSGFPYPPSRPRGDRRNGVPIAARAFCYGRPRRPGGGGPWADWLLRTNRGVQTRP